MHMDRRTFAILCHLLRTVDGLSSIEIVDVEEMVAMFLHVIAHDLGRISSILANSPRCPCTRKQTWCGAGNVLTTANEYFNMKHSSARNVIERAFGALKSRWAILRGKSYYPLQCGNPVLCPQDVWTKEEEGTLVEFHPTAKGLLNKPFSYYDKLAYVFGCNRTMGRFTEIFTNVGSNEPIGMRDLTRHMGTRSSHPCIFRGLTCTRRMYAHHNLLSHQTCTNDQLKTSAEWPARALVNDTYVHQEFLPLLREMLELTSLDRALCQRHLLSRMDDMQGFVQMTDDEKQNFCRVLL
ncbi:retrotransposon protein [Cucumis melo var. makuwa]|uniref:Retrotransposon protein n=1 Tax=Cucumis melo var. makuwa TaxID=1194695 RepID=A0A5A7T6W3_CUCMM|nr:retrotransposon protein [Cucumis melo var. makuwa]TYK19003.1 retrotransposon protein [Cucumis melo var. makuwa]